MTMTLLMARFKAAKANGAFVITLLVEKAGITSLVFWLECRWHMRLPVSARTPALPCVTARMVDPFFCLQKCRGLRLGKAELMDPDEARSGRLGRLNELSSR